MANEANKPSQWYVEDDGRATGPFTAPQMRAQAQAAKIKPDTRVRKGHRGKWVPAKSVKGLIAISSTMDSRPTSPRPTRAVEAEEGTYLAPLRRRKWRLVIYGLLVLFILIGQAPIPQQLFFDITVGLILGSYPIVEVRKKSIEQTIMVFFFPVHKKTWKLRDFVAVEAHVESRITETIGCLVLLFFWLWFLFRLFDHIMPWLGGNYKLFLRQYDDERLLIWQGSNTADYEANLALFESAGLPIG